MAQRRILLKISGEALCDTHGVDSAKIEWVAERIALLHRAGIELGVVCGAGNWIRGRNVCTIKRTTADQMGMLATVMNGLAIYDALHAKGIVSTVFSAVDVAGIPVWNQMEAAIRIRQHPLILVGGTGNPFFSTDSAAALRAAQLECDSLLKATNVDGVYDKDPNMHSDAVRFDVLTFDEAIQRSVQVMDLTAFDLCKQNGIDIHVFDMYGVDSFECICSGDNVGTCITSGVPK